MIITIKDLKDSQKEVKIKDKTISEKGMFNILNQFLKTNSKSVKENGNIIGYELYPSLKLIYYKAKKHKTGNIPIHHAFMNLIEYIKDKNLVKKIDKNQDKFKFWLESFPKPKYKRKYWKTYYDANQTLFKMKRIPKFDENQFNQIKTMNRKFAHILSKKENGQISKIEKEELNSLESQLFKELKVIKNEYGI